MIYVSCREETYVYNAYHMAKAFFPDAEVASSVNPDQKDLILVEPEGEAIEVFSADSKLAAERELYAKLSEYTGRTLPWGILMGVRPTKLASRKIDEGMSLPEFTEWFANERLVSRKKAELCYKVALKEREIIAQATQGLRPEETYSLYVGIPFCPSICSYCSFSSGAIGAYQDKVEDYLNALISEINETADMCAGMRISTVYIGGGTPTTLSAEQLVRLLGCIREEYPDLLEFTVEAGRPDTVTEEKLAVLKKYGVSRISINPQTMQQKTLDLIGRRHSTEEVTEAFRLARSMGFDNINMDLIMGLPGETISDARDTLRQIEELRPDSLTVHSLAIKRAAQLSQDERRSGVPAAEIEEMIEAAAECAARMGMEPYYLYRQKSIAGNFENVGYAMPGREGVYNVLIMEEVQSIIACGAGGSSKIVLAEKIPNPNRGKKELTNIVRCENVKNISEYISREPEMVERKKEILQKYI